MKVTEQEIRDYAQKMINLPEAEHPISFNGFSSKDYINYLENLLCGRFRFNVEDFDMWTIAQEELEK